MAVCVMMDSKISIFPVGFVITAFLAVCCFYGYKYRLVLFETWCSDYSASLLRNINNDKYGLVFEFSRICHMDFPHIDLSS